MADNSREVQIFTKPIGPVCNLDCRYCYYLDKEDLYPKGESFRMDGATLERYVRAHIDLSPGSEASFCWHGGEPTLLGVDFYREAVALQRRYASDGQRVRNNIQTNGTLLDEEWAAFLAKEEFSVGLSLDGPEEMHDPLRITKADRPSHADALRGYRLLREHGVPTDILCVVHSGNVASPLKAYRFFKEIGAEYIGFIPLVEQIPGRSGEVTERSVDAAAFGRFMIAIFDEWKRADAGRIMVQLFEEVARSALGQEHGLCIFRPTCGDVPVVEHNGDVFSCDHYVTPAFRLGNLAEEPLDALVGSERQRAFGAAKRAALPDYCMRCEVLDLCNGGCPKDRIISSPEGETGLNYLCKGYRTFFNHCRPFMAELTRQNRGGRPRAVAAKRIGRNDPCPCGSGLKYKQCCLRA